MNLRLFLTTTICGILVGQSTQAIASDYIAAGKLIFGNWHIVTMNADGTNEQILSSGSHDNHTVVPSPIGNELVFMSSRTGQQQVFIMNRDGSNVRQLTFVGSNMAPSWSPDGSRIVFAHVPVGSPGGYADIATINVDGTGFARLTNSSGVHETGPVIRPDGQKIAFSRGNDGPGAIWMMDPSGANQVQITFDDWDEWNPTWSPDGTRVAYHGLSGSDWDIKSVLATGGGAINHTPWSGSQEQGPFYMRDGQLLFTGTSLGVGIYRQNPATSTTVLVKLGTYTAPSVGSGSGNEAPIAIDDSASLNEDSEILIDVLDNDSDPDNNPITITNVGTPGFGVATIESGMIRYTPIPNSFGSDSFTYTISDGNGGTATANVIVTVIRLFDDCQVSGFFQPVDMGGITNVAKAGRTIPLKFHVVDELGNPFSSLAISNVIVTSSLSGTGILPGDNIEEYAGNSGLQYLGNGNYQFNWQTPKTYKNQIRWVYLTISKSGCTFNPSVISAKFSFR